MTRVPVSKKHTSSNESTKLVDETSSSYTYIHIHAHTFLSISPVHRSKKKKKKENKRTHSGKHVHARKKKRKKNSYLNSCMLLTRAYILYVPVYRLLCSYSSTVLLLIFERIVSILFLSWLTNEEKKKKERIELRGVSARILRVDLIRLPLKFARKFLGGKRRSRVEKVVCSRRGQFV